MFLNIPCSSVKTNSPLPPPSLAPELIPEDPPKNLGYGGFVDFILRGITSLQIRTSSFFSVSVFTFISWIPSSAKGAAPVGKGLTLLSWLLLGSLLQNVISSWREKDTKTHDVFGEAQNNISGFRQQTLQMGRASPAAGESWLKIIKQKMFCKMLPKDFKSLSGNTLIEISCLFFQKLFIFLF